MQQKQLIRYLSVRMWPPCSRAGVGGLSRDGSVPLPQHGTAPGQCNATSSGMRDPLPMPCTHGCIGLRFTTQTHSTSRGQSVCGNVCGSRDRWRWRCQCQCQTQCQSRREDKNCLACLGICRSEDGLMPQRQECNIVSNPAVATRLVGGVGVAIWIQPISVIGSQIIQHISTKLAGVPGL